MTPRDVLDTLLEIAVVPSFARLGPRIRRRLYGWRDPEPGALVGRTALVTGATGGLGRATVEAFAGLGARVVLVGRDEGKLEKLRAELEARHGGTRDGETRDGGTQDGASNQGEARFPIVTADLASLGAVREAVAAIGEIAPELDIVVDNAGAIFPARSRSDDGIESSLALLAIGPFALVSGLMPLLRKRPGARIIAVTSGGQYTQPLDVEDLDGEDLDYSGPRFYARAKRAQVALVREWARRLGPTGPAVNAMHPGWAATPGLAESLPGFSRLLGPLLRTPEEGVDTIVWLATAPRAKIGTGRLYLDRRPRPFDRVPWTRLSARERRRLWDAVVARAAISDPAPERAPRVV